VAADRTDNQHFQRVLLPAQERAKERAVSENGDGNGKIYVKFGPGPAQEMPIEWAEKMLTDWRQRDAARFGKALAAVVTEGVGR
jgi:hypothetical protein